MTGVRGAAPRPVTVKMRTADQGESMANVAPPTICVALTRQKYVPLGKPLTLSAVGVGMPLPRSLVNPARTICVKPDVVATCHV